MLRRGFVRAMISVIVAPRALLSQQAGKTGLPPPAPVPWTLGLNPKTPLPQTEVADTITESEQRFFTAAQMATLVRLSDVFLPPLEGKPGALQAETPVFLDFLIGTSPAARQAMYVDGLNWLDAEAQTKYKRPFAKLDDVEADALLKPSLRTWMNDHPPTELHANFINIAHDDIRTATLNSKAWSETVSGEPTDTAPSGLYWYPMQLQPDICSACSGSTGMPHVKAVPKGSHKIPSYPR